MNYKQLKKEFWRAAREMFAPLGYEPLKGDDEHLKKYYPWGFSWLWFNFSKHFDCFIVTLYQFIRIDAIEEIALRNDTDWSEERRPEIFSMGCNLGHLSDPRGPTNELLRWEVSGDEDIPRVVADIVRQFESLAVPYIEKYHDPRNALELFLDDSPNAWFLRTGTDCSRAKQVVATALVVKKDKAWIKAYIERIIPYLATRQDGNIPRFMNFLASLDDPELLPSEIPKV